MRSIEYTIIIDNFTWSYSRIIQFENCPYCFLMKYIKHIKFQKKNFFSEYGLFMHLIIQKYLTNELEKSELADYYLIEFRKSVVGKAPNQKIFNNYFNQGLAYLNNIKPPEGYILAVEKHISFNIDDKKFVGFIDVVSNNDGIIITDNKSRDLKPRTHRKKPTKSDKELDNYLRQLYIYSIAIEQEFNVFPKYLNFNCFRTQSLISEPFDMGVYESVKKWAIGLIEAISIESEWLPKMDYFKCTYLCDYSDQCEYYQVNYPTAKAGGL